MELKPDAVIRAATTEDVGSVDRLLAALSEALGEPDSYSGDVDALRLYGFERTALFHTLLAEQQGNCVGLCVYFPEFSTWRCKPGIYVQDLFVDQASRGRGIGQRMLATAVNDGVAKWDVGYLRLAVHVMNHDAHEFYRALGFLPDTDNRVMLLAGDAFDTLTGVHPA